jgi:hypothetical protein
LDNLAQSALLKALELAVVSLGRESGRRPSDRLHTLTVTGAGAIAGLFGLGAAAVEIPLTTVVMMRSIADIARREGHDISRLQIQLECLSVFALGGPQNKDDAAETGYWAVRTALAREISATAAHIATNGLSQKNAPVIVRLIAAIAERYSISIGDELLGKLVPVVGAFSGGAINATFMHHFQQMAHGHFTLKRLEKKYGEKQVRELYDATEI